MYRSLGIVIALALVVSTSPVWSGEITGDYLESRTCDIYTGPCFANAQMGLTGNQAIMAWSIDQGEHNGVDLSGLKVVMAVRAAGTLGFGVGLPIQPYPIKSVVIVDERANSEQRDALVDFVRVRAGKVAGETVRVASLPIEMELDHVEMVATLKAGKEVRMKTRKLVDGDCVCTNEIVYYPPLTEVENSAPAYALASGFQGRGLGNRWQSPSTRSAFLATFSYEGNN